MGHTGEPGTEDGGEFRAGQQIRCKGSVTGCVLQGMCNRVCGTGYVLQGVCYRVCVTRCVLQGVCYRVCVTGCVLLGVCYTAAHGLTRPPALCCCRSLLHPGLTLASPVLLPCAAAAARFTMPHIAYMAVTFARAIVFCGISFLMTMADFELEPKCKRWLGRQCVWGDKKNSWPVATCNATLHNTTLTECTMAVAVQHL